MKNVKLLKEKFTFTHNSLLEDEWWEQIISDIHQFLTTLHGHMILSDETANWNFTKEQVFCN